MILVGDIGGTNTRLALHRGTDGRLVAETVRDSRAHASFEEIAGGFLAEHGLSPKASKRHRIDVAVFGVAGPVQRGVARVTNLPWKLDERALARSLGVRTVRLLNDLAVAARGCLETPASNLVLLTDAPISPRGQNVGVLAAGTGLGEARLVWDGKRHLALSSEGGHADFAARTPLEVELWHFLSARFPDHVSYERVLCGDGLGILYDFFASRGPRPAQAVARRLAEGDRNRAIAELGLSRGSRAAARAVDLFVSIYGAEAGNLALRELATGGIFVAGNIGKSLVPARRDLFLDGFRRKGRFTAMLTDVPVAVVTDSLVGVRGALAFARDLRRTARR